MAISATNAGRLCSLLTLLTVVLSPLFGDFSIAETASGATICSCCGAALLLIPAYLLLGLTAAAALRLPASGHGVFDGTGRAVAAARDPRA